MGMFDYVRCEYPLPERPEWAQEFQTKSLGCRLDRYRIAANGQVFWSEMEEDQDHYSLEHEYYGSYEIQFEAYSNRTESVAYRGIILRGRLEYVENLNGETPGRWRRGPRSS